MATVTGRITRTEFEELELEPDFLDQEFQLLFGEVVKSPRMSPQHAAMIRALTGLLATAGMDPRIQLPLGVGELSLPFPDVVLTEDGDAEHHPERADLVIEIAWSRQRQAWDVATLFASIAVPTYWIVDLPARTVHVLENPDGERYRTHRACTGDCSVRVAAAGGLELTVTELFARAGLGT